MALNSIIGQNLCRIKKTELDRKELQVSPKKTIIGIHFAYLPVDCHLGHGPGVARRLSTWSEERGVNRSLRQLRKFTVQGPGAEIGRVDRLFVDFERWTIRYIGVLVADSPRRLYLVSPLSLSGVDWPDRRICTRTGLGLTVHGRSIGKGSSVWPCQLPVTAGKPSIYLGIRQFHGG